MRMRATGWRPFLVAVLALTLTLPIGVSPTPTAQAAVTFTVNNTTDEPDANPGDGICSSTPSGACTLRAAVMEANALPGDDTIAVPAGTFVLSRMECGPPCNGSNDDTGAFGDLDLLDSVTITGAGTGNTVVTIGGGLLFDRLLDVAPTGSGVTATIRNLTLQRGSPSGGGGGAMRNAGTSTLQNVRIERAGTFWGGGIYNTGQLTVTDSIIADNTGFEGGGGILNSGAVTLTRVTLSGNRTTRLIGDGGGLYSSGMATITDSVIRDNQTRNSGGGISSGGQLTLNRVTCQREQC